jgi:hypothetical protein
MLSWTQSSLEASSVLRGRNANRRRRETVMMRMDFLLYCRRYEACDCGDVKTSVTEGFVDGWLEVGAAVGWLFGFREGGSGSADVGVTVAEEEGRVVGTMFFKALSRAASE